MQNLMRTALLFSCVCFAFGCGDAAADIFTVRQDDGSIATVEARLYGQARGAMLLLRDDGRVEIIPDAAVVKREPSEGPEPATAEEVASRIEKQFTPELTRIRVAGDHVVAIVLQAPIERSAEGRVRTFLDKVQQFVLALGRNFEQWAKSMKLPADDPEFPLVMIIFETDEDFETYATETTAGGLSVSRLSGFYSHGSNWLAVRSDECDSYSLPLHEGIHQQVYNRGWYKRFAPVPVWFDEGIATGFENKGDKLRGNPSLVNSRYATKSATNMQLSFADVIRSDDGFRGDVLAGDAYTRAWALHWLLVNRYRDGYVEFVNKQRALEPLQKISVDDRLNDFEEIFGVEPDALQAIYEVELDRAARRQRVKPLRPGPPGVTTKQDQSGLVNINVLMTPRGLSTQGTLKNISPFRDLAFRVRVLADNLPPIEWVVSSVRSKQQVKLNLKTVPVRADRFRVEVRSAIPDSREAQIWVTGER